MRREGLYKERGVQRRGEALREGNCGQRLSWGLGFVRRMGVLRGQKLKGENMGSVRRSRLNRGGRVPRKGQVCVRS